LLASHHARTSLLFPSPEVAIKQNHLALPNNACSFLSSPDYQAPPSTSIVGACWVSFAHSWERWPIHRCARWQHPTRHKLSLSHQRAILCFWGTHLHWRVRESLLHLGKAAC